MLRKTLCLIAALALAFSGFALADDLEITQEAFYVTPTLTYYSGQIFGEITNNSDHPMRITDMLYELYDADGSSIASGTIYTIRPRCIAPGERAWQLGPGHCAVRQRRAQVPDRRRRRLRSDRGGRD